jgi:outer membrane lipoprotein-sorting protein
VRALLVWLLLSPALAKAAAPGTDPLGAWLAEQATTRTWSAAVVQTRTLKTLTQPLTARGRVWFRSPDWFRWQLGEPPQTIAIRQPDQMYVIYPELKRAELFPLSNGQAGSWGSALALLEAGFPRNRADLEAKFVITAQTETGDHYQISLQPRSASARRLIPRIEIALAKADYSLRFTQLEFPDGSTLRNDFVNAQRNPEISDELFQPKLDEGYQLVQPLKKK